MKICLVAFYSTYGDNPLTRLSDVLHIFEPLAEETFLITENVPQDLGAGLPVHLINIRYTSNSRFMLVRAWRQLTAQLVISWQLLKLSRQIDIIFWGVSAHVLTLPMILARLIRKKTILFLSFASSGILAEHFGARGFVLPRIYRILEEASYSLCNAIVANSTDLLRQPQLSRHRNKLYPVAAPIRFIDDSLFRITRTLGQRARLVGFVGRLSAEKGVINLIKAIPKVFESEKGLEFAIIGDGPQSKEIRETVKKENLSGRVKITRWVQHNKLPEYLNEMQLLVLPSLTEGLPTIVMEALACGTPVLATSVGGVPELIKDGETGFILADNAPQTIARGIVRALNYPDLDRVVKNARHLIDREYTLEATVERYRVLISNLSK